MPYVIYGDRQIQFELPEGLRLAGILEPRSLPIKGEPLYEGEEAICKAISPEALPSLENGSRILILVDDDTRPTPVKAIAPLLIRALRRIGIEDTRITFLIALGLHPPMVEREIEERLGLEIVRGFKVLNHDPDGGLEFLGRTSQGIDVWVNDLIPKADLKIGIGTLAMHPLGYSGGPKILMPGVTGWETVKAFHSMALRSQRARWGRLDGNPFLEGMEEAAKMAGLNLVVNTVFNADGEVVRVLVGDPRRVVREGGALLDTMFKVRLQEPFDIAVTSSHPLDMNLFQGLKGAFFADSITREGGTIVLVAPCFKGLGPYRDRRGRNMLELSLQEVFEGVERDDVNPSEAITPHLFRELQERKEVIVVSHNLSEEDAKRANVRLEKRLRDVLEGLSREKRGASVAVIPRGASHYGASRAGTASIGKYPSDK